MTWAANGAFPGQTEFVGGGTVSLTNTAAGDLVLMIALSIDSTANYVNSVTGGGCTWTQIGTHHTGSVNGMIATAWQGTVTATGAQTATIGVTGGGPTIAIVTQEFSSTVGSWSVDEIVYLDSAGTNTWPTVTPSGSGELAFGFAVDSGIAVAGSTSGWHYEVTSHNDGCAWDVAVSAATAAVWGDSGQQFGPVILVKETGGISHTATVSLTVTPSLGVSPGLSVPVALTVVPSFTVARTQAHVRTAALAVTPRFQVATSGGEIRSGGSMLVLMPATGAC